MYLFFYPFYFMLDAMHPMLQRRNKVPFPFHAINNFVFSVNRVSFFGFGP